MSRFFMMTGILIYVAQVVINRFFYTIPDSVHLVILVVSCALMMAGIIGEKRAKRK